MVLRGIFTFISLEIRERDGKKYYNVNIESEEGSLMRLATDEQVVTGLQKYQKYTGFFKVGTYNNSMYMRLVGTELLQEKK